MTKNTSDSPMKKGNILAVAIVVGLFIYILNHDNTPPPPPDRTVYSKKTSTGSATADQLSNRSETSGNKMTGDAPSGTNTTQSSSSSGSDSPTSSEAHSENSGMPSGTRPTAPVGTTSEPGNPSTDAQTLSGASQSGATQSGLTTYYNSYLDYGLSIPKWSFYAGYGWQGGAAHTMGFATGTGVSSFETAEIKLWYFPNKILPELKDGENSFYQDPSTNMTYLKLGNGTIRMEWDMENPILLKIVETVYRGD